MWYKHPFFKYTVGIILILTIFLLLYETAPLFSPILWFVTAVLLPLLFATLLYYVLRPAVHLLESWRIPRYVSILITYLGLLILIGLFVVIIVPRLVNELTLVSNIPPEKIESLKSFSKEWIEKAKSYISLTFLPQMEAVFYSVVQKINPFIYQMAVNTISTLTSIAIALVLTPFVLFYFLRDDYLFSKSILRFVPSRYQDEVQKILFDIDDTLSGFILSQMLVAVVVGFFLLCGYLIIGLPEAVALALFAMIFYVIPIFGTIIAVIPAFFVGLSISLGMGLKVLLVMVLAHILEANLLTPRVMSHRLQIHPLTIILLLLAAGTLYGLLGLLLVTPTYAIVKVIVWNLYKISRLRYALSKVKSEEAIPQGKGIDKH